uniref:Carrier domain-containing protein n=1 Tax=Chromera velia CCMP2878 TaxID=1169474 RepID=A0A0G4I1R9_9ALVE|eukprot:Cvel_1691.t1-p1 / transcript=Cvel_1691.t1 / gene=Cvel_1691 / organism=Chromera_velia_CCMP2878 / gene_product=Linear gramicidin synthase subunit D, putative / transcript_product=Linear gramicidin synthase subunit D, putative / location=Cvel_scaffold60:143365-151227(+) / protein_length=2096 / sequence_SO=supercontig / SO=protein_coding / is_pseudo=false
MKLESPLLHEVFCKAAADFPENTAVESPEEGITLPYREVDLVSDRLSLVLSSFLGVNADDLVGIFLPRCAHFYVCMLSVLKAGGGYVSLDPDYPEDRVFTIIEESRATVVIVVDAYLPSFQKRSLPICTLSEDSSCIRAPLQREKAEGPLIVPLSICLRVSASLEGDSPLTLFDTIQGTHSSRTVDAEAVRESRGVRRCSPQDVAYCIFTSGSTGKPKGVAIEHRNAVNFVLAEQIEFPTRCTDRVLQGFSTCFDASVEEIWLAFASGGTLVVGSKRLMRSGPAFGSELAALEVSVLSTVPTVLRVCDDVPPPPLLRLVITGGEACPPEVVDKWCAPGRRFLNTYGPTEATVVATYAELQPGQPVSIGHPLPGYGGALLRSVEEAGEGEGELWIGGLSVARGYVNRPDLNPEKFVSIPKTAREEDEARALTPLPNYLTHNWEMLVGNRRPIASREGARGGELIEHLSAESAVRALRPEVAGLDAEGRLDLLDSCGLLSGPADRWYRTGDLVSLDSGREEGDGGVGGTLRSVHPGGLGLFFRGRIDSQVKIRGFRVELSEVESAVCRHPLVANAAVIARDDLGGGGALTLVAYVETSGVGVGGEAETGDSGLLTPADLRNFVAEQLPAYMVPSRFVCLVPGDRLPSMPSGKVDSKKLKSLPPPGPESVPREGGGGGTGGEVEEGGAPETALEFAMISLWEKALQASDFVSASSDFFLLGGNSLTAAQLVGACRRELPSLRLSVRDVYESPVLRVLCSKKEEEVKEGGAGGVKALRQELKAVMPSDVFEKMTKKRGSFIEAVEGTASAVWDSFCSFLSVGGNGGDRNGEGMEGGRDRLTERNTRSLVTCLQGLVLLLNGGFVVLWNVVVVLALLFLVSKSEEGEGEGETTKYFPLKIPPFALLILFSPLAAAAYRLLCLSVALVLKWTLLGTVREGDASLWGWKHFRWWVVQQWTDAVPLGSFSGTPLIAGMLRMFGARVGPNVEVHSRYVDVSGYDLLEMGEGAVVGVGTLVKCAEVAEGSLRLRKIRLGRGASVGNMCFLGEGARVGRNSVLEDSSGLSGGCVGDGEIWCDAPAKKKGERGTGGQESTQTASSWRKVAFCLGWILAMSVMEIALGLPRLLFVVYVYRDLPLWMAACLVPPLAVWSAVIGPTLFAVIARYSLFPFGVIGAGRDSATFRLYSFTHFRFWALQQALARQQQSCHALYSTVYASSILRLLGASVGKSTEVSDATHWTPDAVQIGDFCFVADAVHLGGWKLDRETQSVTVRRVSVGSRTFLGNNSYAPGGTELGDDNLVAVASTAPKPHIAARKSGASWLGAAAFEMPSRDRAAADSSTTFAPPLRQVLARASVEAYRCIAPSLWSEWCFLALYCALSATVGVSLASEWSDPETWIRLGRMWGIFAAAPLWALVYCVCLGGVVLVHKWLLVGQIKEGRHPLWSSFVWRAELATAMADDCAWGGFARCLGGTLFAPVWFRLLGSKVGKRCYIDTPYLVEFDLVRVGDGACIDRGATLQTHLFEDRVMKTGRVEVGDRASVGCRAVVLYGGSVGAGCRLKGLSLKMKGESFEGGEVFSGIPAVPVPGGASSWGHQKRRGRRGHSSKNVPEGTGAEGDHTPLSVSRERSETASLGSRMASWAFDALREVLWPTCADFAASEFRVFSYRSIQRAVLRWREKKEEDRQTGDETLVETETDMDMIFDAERGGRETGGEGRDRREKQDPSAAAAWAALIVRVGAFSFFFVLFGTGRFWSVEGFFVSGTLFYYTWAEPVLLAYLAVAAVVSVRTLLDLRKGRLHTHWVQRGGGGVVRKGWNALATVLFELALVSQTVSVLCFWAMVLPNADSVKDKFFWGEGDVSQVGSWTRASLVLGNHGLGLLVMLLEFLETDIPVLRRHAVLTTIFHCVFLPATAATRLMEGDAFLGWITLTGLVVTPGVHILFAYVRLWLWKQPSSVSSLRALFWRRHADREGVCVWPQAWGSPRRGRGEVEGDLETGRGRGGIWEVSRGSFAKSVSGSSAKKGSLLGSLEGFGGRGETLTSHRKGSGEVGFSGSFSGGSLEKKSDREGGAPPRLSFASPAGPHSRSLSFQEGPPSPLLPVQRKA